jgi:outer membrane protein
MKNNRKKYYFFCLFVLFSGIVLKQAKGQTSDPTFTFQNFASIVEKNHPLVKQANLYRNLADGQILESRGNFDPKLGSAFERKALSGLDYYNRWENSLKIPLWLGGTDIKLSHERNTGQYLLSEESNDLTSLGITIPLGQGLMTDARRTAVRQAQIARDMAEAERNKLLNKTIYQAAKDYWDWQFTHEQLRWQQEGLRLAAERFRGIRERALLGDQAAIDSVEANITLQDRQVNFQEALIEQQNARLTLSTHLWNEQNAPAELGKEAIPQPTNLPRIDGQTLQRLLDFAQTQHPEIAKLGFKRADLNVEERLRRELFKPTLNFNFNILTYSKLWQQDSFLGSLSPANQKLGVDFAFPIFLRKERGKLQQVQVKQMQVDWERKLATRLITNDIETAYNIVQNLYQQCQIQQEATRNQETLVRAEKQKFDLGESTLFLLNQRENKLIEMQIKVASLRAKYQKALAELAYVAGLTSL